MWCFAYNTKSRWSTMLMLFERVQHNVHPLLSYCCCLTSGGSSRSVRRGALVMDGNGTLVSLPATATLPAVCQVDWACPPGHMCDSTAQVKVWCTRLRSNALPQVMHGYCNDKIFKNCVCLIQLRAFLNEVWQVSGGREVCDGRARTRALCDGCTQVQPPVWCSLGALCCGNIRSG